MLMIRFRTTKMVENKFFKKSIVNNNFDKYSLAFNFNNCKIGKEEGSRFLKILELHFLINLLKWKWILIFSLGSFNLLGQSDFSITHINEEDQQIIKLQSQADIFFANNELDKCYDEIGKISDIYNAKYKYKNLIHYLKIQVELGKKIEDTFKEIMPLIEIVNIQLVLHSGEKDYYDNIGHVSKYAENSKLSPYSRSTIYFLMATFHGQQMTFDSAIIFTKKAIHLLDGNVEFASKDLSNKILLARFYKRKGNLIDALLHLLDTESKMNPEIINPIVVYRLYDLLGNIFETIEDYPKAKYYMQKALEHAKSKKLNEMVIHSQNQLGEIETKLGNIDEGIYLLEDAIKNVQNSRFKREKPIAYISLAHIYLEQNALEIALKNLDSAAVNIHFSPSQIRKNNLNEGYADYYTRKGNKLKAKHHIDLLTENSKRKYRLLYEFHKQFKNENLALLNFEKHIQKRDSIKARNKLITIQRIESEYNRKQQDIEINSLTSLTAAQDKALSIRNTALVLGGLMLVIWPLSYLVYTDYSPRIKKIKKNWQGKTS